MILEILRVGHIFFVKGRVVFCIQTDIKTNMEAVITTKKKNQILRKNEKYKRITNQKEKKELKVRKN